MVIIATSCTSMAPANSSATSRATRRCSMPTPPPTFRWLRTAVVPLSSNLEVRPGCDPPSRPARNVRPPLPPSTRRWRPADPPDGFRGEVGGQRLIEVGMGLRESGKQQHPAPVDYRAFHRGWVDVRLDDDPVLNEEIDTLASPPTVADDPTIRHAPMVGGTSRWLATVGACLRNSMSCPARRSTSGSASDRRSCYRSARSSSTAPISPCRWIM